MFSYGQSKNMDVYGTKEPPFIDIKEIKEVPIALFVGNRDILANLKDNRWLKDELGSNLVFYKEFFASHSSFVTGRDMSYFEKVI